MPSPMILKKLTASSKSTFILNADMDRLTDPQPPIFFAGKIAYRYWQGGSSHVLIYLHGIQSHSGWLVDSGKKLAQKGFTVYAPDRRGSGLSEFPVGDIESYQVYLQDLRSFFSFVRQREPYKKIHLMGLCWGARLCLPLCVDKEKEISSVILLSPGLFPRVDYSFFKKIEIGWNYFIHPKKKFSLPLKDSFFTQNPIYLKFIEEDPLGLRRVSARFLIETLKLNQLARKVLPQVHQPIYLLLAGQDKIVDTEKTIAQFQKNQHLNLCIKLYPGWEHTLEFEPAAERFYDDLAHWLQEQRGK